MSATIALLCLLLLLLLALLLLRPSPTLSTPHLIPVSPPPPPLPLQSRQVSFSIVSADTSYSLPIFPPPPFPVQRRWPSSLHKRNPSIPDSPRPPHLAFAHPATVDQFGRILSSSPLSNMHSPQKSSRRISTPLRLSFTSKRRSSSTSYTSTLIHLDQVGACATSPLPSTSATRSPLQRTKFVNPFSKHARPRTLSPPSTFKSADSLSSNPTSMSSPSSPARRRTLVNKFKSIFKSKSIPPEPSPIIHSKPILTTINSRLRRKPVARTQPYGPPWNAPMPVPDWTLSQHSLQKPAQTSPSPQTSRKCSDHQGSRPEITSMSPGQLSPRTFINELDEKLSLLQDQRIRNSIPSPRG